MTVFMIVKRKTEKNGLSDRNSGAVLLVYSFYPDYLDRFLGFVNDLVVECSIEFVVFVSISEASLLKAKKIIGGARRLDLVLHDNVGWEFGGYQRGIDYVFQSGFDINCVVVINDTVGSHFFVTKRMLRRFCLLTNAAIEDSSPVIVGEVHSSISDFFIENIPVDEWVQSCFFSFNSKAIMALKKKLYVKDLAGRIFLDENGLCFKDGVCSKNLEGYINKWLGLRPSSGNTWYGAKGSSLRTDQFYINKAASILNEKFLSALVVKHGGKLLNVFPSSRVLYFLYKLERKFKSIRSGVEKF